MENSIDLTTSFSPTKLYFELKKSGEEWAAKDAQYSIYEQTRKSILAEEFLASQASTVVSRDHEANASARYKEHIKKMCSLKEEANIAKIKYDSIKIYIEMLRTNESSKREVRRAENFVSNF